MQRIFFTALAGSSLLLLSFVAGAQVPSEQTDNPFYSPDQYRLTHSMFDRINNDLDRARTDAYPNYLGDAPRFDIAHRQLAGLEQNWDQAKYDSQQMERTVAAIRMVLSDNRLTGHDQNLLDADLSRLLTFETDYY